MARDLVASAARVPGGKTERDVMLGRLVVSKAAPSSAVSLELSEEENEFLRTHKMDLEGLSPFKRRVPVRREMNACKNQAKTGQPK
jgi:hypothetical protein